MPARSLACSTLVTPPHPTTYSNWQWRTTFRSPWKTKCVDVSVSCSVSGHPIDKPKSFVWIVCTGPLVMRAFAALHTFSKISIFAKAHCVTPFCFEFYVRKVVITWPPFTHKPSVAQLNLAPGGEKKRLFLWSNKCQCVRCVTSDSPVSRLMDLLSSASLVFSLSSVYVFECESRKR